MRAFCCLQELGFYKTTTLELHVHFWRLVRWKMPRSLQTDQLIYDNFTAKTPDPSKIRDVTVIPRNQMVGGEENSNVTESILYLNDVRNRVLNIRTNGGEGDGWLTFINIHASVISRNGYFETICVIAISKPAFSFSNPHSTRSVRHRNNVLLGCAYIYILYNKNATRPVYICANNNVAVIMRQSIRRSIFLFLFYVK